MPYAPLRWEEQDRELAALRILPCACLRPGPTADTADELEDGDSDDEKGLHSEEEGGGQLRSAAAAVRQGWKAALAAGEGGTGGGTALIDPWSIGISLASAVKALVALRIRLR